MNHCPHIQLATETLVMLLCCTQVRSKLLRIKHKNCMFGYNFCKKNNSFAKIHFIYQNIMVSRKKKYKNVYSYNDAFKWRHFLFQHILMLSV